ncbi:MAG: hypothetical protein MUC39_00005 [Candidatus Omnitrophica bacterium]|jgi:hypothetical protein|nr:hypothetical protein [Candidatus Omnitrophota bacterium]
MRLAILQLILFFSFLSCASAAPCYGTKLPEKNKFFANIESYSLFKRYLGDGYGKLRSQQEFYGMSYGVFDWLSIDLKAGGGTINQHPVGSDEVSYSASFAGGYGVRVKFLDKNNFRANFGFQHISVHPKSTYVADVRNRAILDDWQWSVLGSYSFKRVTPYLGTRWSRVDYIHWVGNGRKRRMSDRTKSIGLIWGFDIPFTQKIWLNLEGSAFDSEALACSVNYSF